MLLSMRTTEIYRPIKIFHSLDTAIIIEQEIYRCIIIYTYTKFLFVQGCNVFSFALIRRDSSDAKQFCCKASGECEWKRKFYRHASWLISIGSLMLWAMSQAAVWWFYLASNALFPTYNEYLMKTAVSDETDYFFTISPRRGALDRNKDRSKEALLRSCNL